MGIKSKNMIKMVFVFIVIFLYGVSGRAENIDKFIVGRVYDSDTFFINLPCDIDIVCKNVGVRVNGIDAPEIKGKCQKEKDKAVAGRVFTEMFLRGDVYLLNCEKEKYGRLLCDVFVNGEDLGEALIRANLAIEYHGEKRTHNWCK